MLRARRVGGYERQVDIGLHRCGELALGFLACLFEPLEGHAVLPEVYALELLELISPHTAGKFIGYFFSAIFHSFEFVSACQGFINLAISLENVFI